MTAPAMAALFASGRAVDIVLVVIAIEGLWLVGVQRRRVGDVALVLLPGVFMLLALRAALAGLAWPWIAAALLASFPVHLADLGRRWRR